MAHCPHSIYWILDNKVISLGNIITLHYSVTISPINVITTPEFLYVPSIISFYMFLVLVWPSSIRKNASTKGEMLQKRSSLLSPPPNLHSVYQNTVNCSCLFLARQPPQWARAPSFTRFLEHIQRRTTVDRTRLDEWSARRRDLYITTHNNHNRQTSMPPVGFEPTISAG